MFLMLWNKVELMNQSLSPRRHANTQIPHYHAHACFTLTNRKRKWELLYQKNGILLWIVTDLWPSFSYGSVTLSVCRLDTVEVSILYIPSYISDYVTKEDKFSAQHIELKVYWYILIQSIIYIWIMSIPLWFHTLFPREKEKQTVNLHNSADTQLFHLLSCSVCLPGAAMSSEL